MYVYVYIYIYIYIHVSTQGKPETYTPVFDGAPSVNTASVNAGDYNLYVGGGAINLAFAKALGAGGTNAYQQLHEMALREAEASPGGLCDASRAPEAAAAMAELGLAGCFARVLGGGDGPRGPVGAVFVDVLAAGRRPASPRNVAMLYVVGPKGQGATGGQGPTVAGRAAFLQAVEDMGANAMLALREYNRGSTGEGAADVALPRVDAVQFCLVSGGVYRHPETSKQDVADAIVRGLVAGSSGGGDPLPLVRFAYDEEIAIIIVVIMITMINVKQ